MGKLNWYHGSEHPGPPEPVDYPGEEAAYRRGCDQALEWALNARENAKVEPARWPKLLKKLSRVVMRMRYREVRRSEHPLFMNEAIAKAWGGLEDGRD